MLETRQALQDRFDATLDSMFAARALFMSSQSVDRDEWSSFVRALEHGEWTTSHSNGYGYITREADAFLVTYFEPREPNQQYLGWDLGRSGPAAAALTVARDTGNAALVAMRSVDPSAAADAFLIFLPIYKRESRPLVGRPRQELLSGDVARRFSTGELLGRVVQRHPEWSFDIYAGPNSAVRALVFSRMPGNAAVDYPESLVTRITLAVADQRWHLVLRPTAVFLKSYAELAKKPPSTRIGRSRNSSRT